MSPALNAAYPAVVDRLAADPELASDFGDTPAGICELQATMAELGWIPLWHVEGSAPEDSRKPSQRNSGKTSVSTKVGAVSAGHRNERLKLLASLHPAERASRAIVEREGDVVEERLVVQGKIGALREIPTQQAVGVFV